MSVQRQLNALLFELQTAQSPLAQAKILARSWRTLRDLSPTDRRLLARHAGFDGAEQILEGLATKKRGFAPAALLEMLNKARATDGATVAGILAGLRDPLQREETVVRGADLVSEVFRDRVGDERPQEIVDALDELHSVKQVDQESPEEALVALNALRDEAVGEASPPPLAATRGAGADPPAPAAPRSAAPAAPPKPKAQPQPKPHPLRKAPTRVAPSEGWDRLGETPRRDPPATGARTGDRERTPVAPRSSAFDAGAGFAALGAASSSFSRLRVLDREMQGFQRSSLGTLRELIENFPDGWVRRRALVALITAGVPPDAAQALLLIAGLEREVDRRWCLGALARRGDLKGPVLERSLELVSSPAGRRRLLTVAASR
jgi:hypothetical protein